MKKFKKSAVVIPALARIAVTAAASVSGTVAWFTANRSVTVNASNFAAQSQNGDLTISLVDNTLLGVTEDTDSKSVKRADNSVLTDASFDLTNLYTKVMDDDGNVTGFKDLGVIKVDSGNGGGEVFNSNWSANAGSGVTLYYAVSWTWNFTYTFTSDTTDMALYFDLGASSFAFTEQKVNKQTVDMTGTHQDTYTGNVSKGFRLAMVSKASTENEPKNIVWAPEGANVKSHVNGTAKENKPDFLDSEFHADLDAEHYHKATDVLNKGETGDTQITDSNNAYCYLGRLTKAKNSFNVVCTAWFEGTDETNVINSAQNVAVSATQKFYVRKTPKK